ncbi:pyruvate phosphate dikinase PEP/pyruvate binding subunit [Desulfosarcina widdelii]|uniref:Phosphoenolpyruvate synthase n=1 Tax=Desulfosarcina widdelii TaxID=947919 RepID=A0A5K7Z3A1_9BACT|nr:PEP/pyruvate-binding domain-containing protein [Desulfosarcina widdelii]BBO75458.1 pyruvate phosphate dikinase PEP/pyruvate binding subunit [Desulfosarcina widdelii]
MIKNLFTYWTLQLFKPGAVIREKYTAFQSLLDKDKQAHEKMAELEEIYYDQMPVDLNVIEARYREFADAVGSMIADLARVAPGKYTSLGRFHKRFDDYVRFMLGPPKRPVEPPYVLNLNERQARDASLVGGKAAKLAWVSQSVGLPVPAGFAVTTRAFHRLIEFNDLEDPIAAELERLDINSPASLAEVSNRIGRAIGRAAVPPEVADAIHGELDRLQATCRFTGRFAVRSSAVAEDTKSSFAGQYKTVLNVQATDIVEAYRNVLASKYAPPALVYRINYGLADRETPMAVLVVEMIDAMASGVLYTGQPAAKTGGRLSIHAIWGQGQALVDGATVPAVFRVAATDPPTLVARRPHRQTQQQVFDPERGLVARPLSDKQAGNPPIGESTALSLAQWGMSLEDRLGEPQDVEWCLTHARQPVLLQARPFQAESGSPIGGRPVCSFEDVDNEVLVADGEPAAGGIAAGRTIRVMQIEDLARVSEGAVVVTRNIPPDFAAAVNRMNAVVAEAGSFAGHFASVAREFGIPTLVNAEGALDALPEGIDVTVNAETGTVYRGVVESMVESPCARRNLLVDSPFMKRLGAIMSFISALELVDSQSADFTPEGCRSHHDILRFVHQKAVEAMFQLSNIRFRKVGGSRKLKFGIPMLFYVIDVGGGFAEGAGDRIELDSTQIASRPLQALIGGLTHPDIQWGNFSHFDWESYDKVTLSGGSANPDSVMFASHAIISDRYANLNLRFGYHFVILDTVCSAEEADNYILLRFSGGGADIDKRRLRALFLSQVFQRLGFDVTRTIDLIDARYGADSRANTARTLDRVGRLLGATRLMDMYLKDETMVDAYVDEFMAGRYHFSNVDI